MTADSLKADYMARLGVDAVWIPPFYSSPFDDVSEHTDVDPLFGTLSGFIEVLPLA